jgi:hypothetical protein
MEKLFIEETSDTPQVEFDPNSGKFELKGKALPEDAIHFFRPIYDWLSEYLDQTENPVTVTLDLLYLNSSSTRYIFNILSLLETAKENGRDVQVKWRVASSDEVMLSKGEEMQEMLEVPVILEKY